MHRANEEIYDWLRGIGVQFMPMPLWVERGLHTPGNSVPRWHIVWGTGHELAVVLNRHLLSHPRRDLLELRFDHRVESLVVTNGRVTGCRGATRRRRTRNSRRSGEIGRDRRAAASTATSRACRQNWHADWGATAGDDAERLAQVRGRATARRGGGARRAASRTSTGSGTTRPACITGSRASPRTGCRWCRRSRRCGSTGAASASARCRS